ncbi:hypothetical protein QBC44DRAFT_334583 [Cladorrhinum sp. PSN332]|nr:hypothetical protein QBC44DRAFT_334583 [Cladorrhinum sp. PSN332]
MKLLSSIATSLLLAQSCLAAKRCYYPSGKEAVGDHPCDPDAEDSPCCAGQGLNHHCLSNGLCAGGTQIARGSCTDQSWRSGECTQVCLSAAFSDRGSDLVSCRNATGPDTDSYCCLPNASGDCCNKGIGRFSILAELPHTWATFDSASSKFAIVTPKSKNDPSPSATTTSSSSTSTSATARETASTPTSDPDRDSNGSEKQPGSGQQTENGSSSGLSGGAKAGIAVGAAVGALLIGAILYLLWKLKKSRDMHAAPQAPSYGNPTWGHPSPGGSQWGASAYSGSTAPTHMYAGHPPVPSYYGYDQHQVKLIQPAVQGGELPTEQPPQELPTNHQY